MDVVERGDTYRRKDAKYLNIPLTSLLDHLNGKTKRVRKWAPKACL
jgi:hypothetical protein